MSDLYEAPNISDPERAAVMVMLLEDDQAAQILAQLEPAELRLLGEKMCALGEIGPVAIAQAIAGFVEKTERLGLIAHDRVSQVRSLMTRACTHLGTFSCTVVLKLVITISQAMPEKNITP